MFEMMFRKLVMMSLALLLTFMAACSAPAAEVRGTAVPPTDVPPTDVPPTTAPSPDELLVGAILADDEAEVQRLLEDGADPNLERNLVYPMFAAVNRGNVEIVKLLVEHGGDVTAETATGKSLFQVAVLAGQPQVTEILLEKLGSLIGEITSGGFHNGAITSPALADNLLGDPAIRPYKIYLPPSYVTGDQHYPVIYVLSGNTQDERWLAPLGTDLDEMILSGNAPEMIIVFANTVTAFNGIGLYDSPTTGNYMTYLSHDLVNHIDTNFRTIPHRDSRGIMSCGDGTSSALNLAFIYPDVFSVPIAMTGIYNYEDHLSVWQTPLAVFKGAPKDFTEFARVPWQVQFLMNLAAGAAPNPDKPPFYLDMPLEIVDGQAQIVPEVAAKINAMDPAHFLQTYLDQPLRLRGMLVYHTTIQPLMPVESARAFDTLLTEKGVAHEYIEAGGGNVDQFFCDNELAIQFMAEHLSFEMVE